MSSADADRAVELDVLLTRLRTDGTDGTGLAGVDVCWEEGHAGQTVYQTGSNRGRSKNATVARRAGLNTYCRMIDADGDPQSDQSELEGLRNQVR